MHSVFEPAAQELIGLLLLHWIVTIFFLILINELKQYVATALSFVNITKMCL